jgi:hypothetical protein
MAILTNKIIRSTQIALFAGNAVTKTQKYGPVRRHDGEKAAPEHRNTRQLMASLSRYKWLILPDN